MKTSTATSEETRSVGDLFASRGLRCTRQRQAIYQALADSHRHPSADELHQQVNDTVDGLSMATVYNTLEAFCSAGLAQKIPSADGPARYDASVHDHLHVRDLTTGEVGDVPEDLSEKLLEDLPEP
ncbi:MAG: transcriptional repressor, partial [Phycisphaeraceae bacterium]|nr:transcriptional repressor [Phycisphaeraceae bacterium]